MNSHRTVMQRRYSSAPETDFLSGAARSKRMSLVRSTKTQFELAFVQELLNRGIHEFATHPTGIVGRPDIVFVDFGMCVFLDSDFWHGWQFPRWRGRLRSDFWRNKLEANRKRDRIVNNTLRRRGWKVLRFWEHQIRRDLKSCISRLERALNESRRVADGIK